jgi:hypothetical protein
LGMMFPAGMRMVSDRHRDDTPWFWGINGLGSVLASSVAIVIALEWGLTWLFVGAACCYALLVPITGALRRISARG